MFTISVLEFLDGKKTYLVALAIIVYSILAMLKVVPNPDQLAIWVTGIAAMAVALRSTLEKFLVLLKDLDEKSPIQ